MCPSWDRSIINLDKDKESFIENNENFWTHFYFTCNQANNDSHSHPYNDGDRAIPQVGNVVDFIPCAAKIIIQLLVLSAN